MEQAPPDPALARYLVISAYLAADPPRGRRTAFLAELARKTWLDEHGDPMNVAPETLRVWVRRYRKHGLAGLRDKARPRPGTAALTPEQVDAVVALREEVRERSLDRLIRIAEQCGVVPVGVLKRSTVHRILARRGLSARPPRERSSPSDLDRFEADFPNDLWQSDALAGPWLPDPDRKGKMRRAWLFTWLDDHSRLLLHGRFDWKQGQPALEVAFRRALAKHGIPRRCYFDNGKVYRSRHTARIAAVLGIHGITYTQARRPEGHGKIEAFNRLCRSAFLPELSASRVRTLDQLNEAFVAWVDLDYNRQVHGETGQTPLARWLEAAGSVRYATEDKLREAFLFSEARTADKSGVFSLLGVQYQVGPQLAGRRFRVLFDPEDPAEVECWLDGRLVERVRPLVVHSNRRPMPSSEPRPRKAGAPRTDWLAHLVERRHAELGQEPTPQQLAEAARQRRIDLDEAAIEVLQERLSPAAWDRQQVVDWLARFGPISAAPLAHFLDVRFELGEPRDRHPTHYLELAREATGDNP